MKSKHVSKRDRPAKEKQERVSVTLHFIKGVDDDAIEALEKWPLGDRSYNLKQALLGRLQELRNLEKPPDVRADIESLAESLQWLQHAFKQFPGTIEEMLSNVSISSGTALTNNKKSANPSRREERMKASGWD